MSITGLQALHPFPSQCKVLSREYTRKYHPIHAVSQVSTGVDTSKRRIVAHIVLLKQSLKYQLVLIHINSSSYEYDALVATNNNHLDTRQLTGIGKFKTLTTCFASQGKTTL